MGPFPPNKVKLFVSIPLLEEIGPHAASFYCHEYGY